MPIRPENRARYPKDWPEISRRIREDRASNQCECTGECGLWHVIVPETGRQIDLTDGLKCVGVLEPVRCTARNGEPHPVTKSKVVLTTAHKDHQPENIADDNLAAWCQRCHNRYDAKTRAAGIKERRRAAAAVGDFFCT